MTELAVSAIEVSTPDGVVLRGQLWAGADAWVVLLHDRGEDEDLDCWAPLAPVLAARGWTVLTIDLRGHGASDGDWDPALAEHDITSIVQYARKHGAAFVAVAGAGVSATAALRSVGATRPDALALLSPWLAPDQPQSELRGMGEAKLILVGGGDAAARTDSERLAKAAIGWVLHVSLPGTAQGTAMLHGPAARHLIEHVSGFLAERRFLAGHRPGRHVADQPRRFEAAGAMDAGATERSGNT